MPSLAKTALAAALSYSGALSWLGRRQARTPLVLGYHRVVEDVAASADNTLPGMTVSQRMFRAQLEWVSRRYRIVSLDELGARLERGEPCGQLAAITFDDGYRDVYEYALPVMQQVGVPGAVFVVSSLVSDQGLPLHDELYEHVRWANTAPLMLPPSFARALSACGHDPGGGQPTMIQTVRALLALPPTELRGLLADLRARAPRTPPPSELTTLDWEALTTMARAGVTIGSHTRTHAMLDREDDDTVREELARSRAELEAGLGQPVLHFAYPDGRFSPRVVRAVAAAGYRYAYTICDHALPELPLLTIPRVMLWEGSCSGAFGRFSSSLMRCHSSGVLPFMGCDDHHELRGAAS